jgi:LmbE family N-acetylglucosaminyl deacetylase
MDDEVIGCGGTLYKHIRSGAEVTVVYMTDGRYGGKIPHDPSAEKSPGREKEIIEIRKREARLVMETLGIKEGFFLDAEDSQLRSTVEMQNKLRRILETIQPDLVYLPFFLEELADHRATSQVLLDATEGTNLQFDCCGYEVWTPLFPNCLVQIGDVVEIKKRALQHYQSQLAEKDYIHASLGLNAYRSILLAEDASGFVEAFFLASLREYRGLYEFYCEAGTAKGSQL